MQVVFAHRDNVGDGIDQQTCQDPIEFDHDDHVPIGGFPRWQVQPACEVHDRKHSAAQVDDAAHVVRRVRHGRGSGPAADLSDGHDVEGVFLIGDPDAGFAVADFIVERSYKTKPVHQGYIEPHACVVSAAKDNQATIWSSSQGHFMVRNATAKMTGMAVADIGAGTGLFEPQFAALVGEAGVVYAVDLSPGMIDHLNERKAAEGWANVEVVQCEPDDVKLPRGSVDRVFICDTYHHFEFPRTTMATIRRAMRPDAELIIVDFERIPGVSREWLLSHVRCGKETVIEELESFGFELIEEIDVPGLRENYVLRLRRR